MVNEAFRRRIEETKEAKTKLEIQHLEVNLILEYWNTDMDNIEIFQLIIGLIKLKYFNLL